MTSAPSTKSRSVKERADPGNERHPPHRLDAADELVALGDLLALGAHHAHCGRPRCRLCRGRSGKREKKPQERLTVATSGMSVARTAALPIRPPPASPKNGPFHYRERPCSTLTLTRCRATPSDRLRPPGEPRSPGIGHVIELMQPFGEPGGEPICRHALIDLGRGGQAQRWLAAAPSHSLARERLAGGPSELAPGLPWPVHKPRRVSAR